MRLSKRPNYGKTDRIVAHRIVIPDAGYWSLGILAISAVLLIVLRSVPALDVAISEPFFTEQTCRSALGEGRCGVFKMARSPFWLALRDFGMQLPRFVGLLILIRLLWLVFLENDKKPGEFFAPLAGLISLLLGPILITNLILKSWWGRPRPFQTDDFGGDAPYVAPGTISDFCNSNCSFVSGEATAAFWMVWIVPFLPAGMRLKAVISIGVLAIFISGLRVAFGRHYFSDVTMAIFVALFAITVSVWTLQMPAVQEKLEELRLWSNALALGWRRASHLGDG